ncbi:histone-lysine N-methyltransferase SETMAR [Elysia marginata]|uniref:Histone-lysine N-methyltransferase SETMAR n=1 Tax=Elysia marginata TaxID=1093978 RepID=A0AAV4EN78_9GAST|nr:histone-lysine N-methyltransferase SETMAR [Elysia marginata]
MEDEPRPGRPVTACGDANISKVLVSLSDDRRKTCEEISTETSMSRTSVFRVLTNKLNKKKKFSKWVPHLLTLTDCCDSDGSTTNVQGKDYQPSDSSKYLILIVMLMSCKLSNMMMGDR